MNVLITGGATNEYIDEVMKITNMSTGRLAVSMANIFLKRGWNVSLIINKTVHLGLLYEKEYEGNLEVSKVETTSDMLDSLFEFSQKSKYDYVIHSAAVADYNCDYTFLLEDMAKEIFNSISKGEKVFSEENILEILKNPKCKINNNTKISSYQPNLTVKLGLTPKLISNLRDLFGDAYIIGFKLLDDVTNKELLDAGLGILRKNKLDAVICNDLKDLRHGRDIRYVISKNNYKDTSHPLIRTAFSTIDIVNLIIKKSIDDAWKY